MGRSSKRKERLAQAKRLAREEYGGRIAWRRLVEEHPEVVRGLNAYEQRRVKGEYMTWLYGGHQ